MGNGASDNVITSHIDNGTEAVQEPVNGNNKLETIWDTSSSEHRVVGCQDHDQASGGNRSSSSASDGRKKGEENVVAKGRCDAIQDSQPHTGTWEVDSRAVLLRSNKQDYV